MVTQVSITIRGEDEHKPAFIKDKILLALAAQGIPFRSASEITPVFIKKSIDARHGRVKLVMRYDVYIGESPREKADALPVWKQADGKKRVVIVGAGPAGLFGALRLLEDGIKPIIIERGSVTTERKKDIAAISTRGIVDADSNYCFGEGGAGTFSDGKLYTRSNKRGDIGRILRIFVAFGAHPAILTDAHPHIGTDKLPHIINAMREKIIALGGEFLFDTKCVGFETDGARVTGARLRGTKTGVEQVVRADAVVLAAGHSANDIYELLAHTAPAALEEKSFAVGVRVEHPRELIDSIQFHGKDMAQAAEYRLTTQVDGRGVYSFCMCPGGFIVPSSTAPQQIVINGMSSAARNSRWSNSAIVVETRPEDIPAECRARAQQDGVPALAGLYWRTQLESQTARHGNGQQAPAQRLTDFLAHKDSLDLPRTSYTPGVVPSRLDAWLPAHVGARLATAFQTFNKLMRGFICDDALLVAIETRTSTPVRIARHKDTLECVALKGLYPAGEGGGYAGGIVSSAMDGENVCASVARTLRQA